jgi:hypothetical protein
VIVIIKLNVRAILLGAILKVKHALLYALCVHVVLALRPSIFVRLWPSLNERLNRGYDHSVKIERLVHPYDREN